MIPPKPPLTPLRLPLTPPKPPLPSPRPPLTLPRPPLTPPRPPLTPPKEGNYSPPSEGSGAVSYRLAKRYIIIVNKNSDGGIVFCCFLICRLCDDI
ncbi:MAG: hypothetical protein LBC74_04315 [Planctomycetaceae bacterium]|nr:hypothetical protein [Planctomycetaceae bacterium]